MTTAFGIRVLSLAGALLIAGVATAQTPASGAASSAPFEIIDNSFFVEEAFNEERGIVQNIFAWTRHDGGWEATFTQEWPAPSMTHQLSYTVPFSGGNVPVHLGDVLVNYRVQALSEGAHQPACAPRLTAILPTGPSDDNGDPPGLQVNLPFSKQVRDVYIHWNAGLTWLHGVPLGSRTASLTSPQLAGSLVWRMQPMWHLMLESIVEFDDTIEGGQHTSHERRVLVSPGIRGGWNLGDRQIVVGAALPVTRASGAASVAFLTYFSYELPFTGKS